MGFFNKYPYSDFHELNLDWVIRTIKETEKKVDDFTVFNTLTWAGEWDASKSYVKWSIVQDNNGNGYISVKAVPSNVPLTNGEYWKLIAKYSDLYAAFNSRIAALETSVGDNTTGLIKDVADINDNIDVINDDINTINARIDSINIGPSAISCQCAGYYDYSSGKLQGGCCDENKLYEYFITSGNNGEIRVFDLENEVYLNTYSSITGYHGNGIAKIGNKIYIVNHTDSSSTPVRTLTVYDISTNTSVSIDPLPVIYKNAWGIAKVDDTHLIIGVNGINTADDAFVIYDVVSGTIVNTLPLIYNINESVIGLWQTFTYINNKIYAVTDWPNIIIKMDITDAGVVASAVYNLGYNDQYGIAFGELENIAVADPANNTLVISGMVAKNNYASGYTLNMHYINTEYSLPAFLHPSKSETKVDDNNTIYVDINSLTIYEDGTAAYPFKDLNRAIEFANSNIINNVTYISIKSGTYPAFAIKQRPHCVYLKPDGGSVTFSGNISLVSSDIAFYGTASDKFIFNNTVYVSDASQVWMENCTLNDNMTIEYYAKVTMHSVSIAATKLLTVQRWSMLINYPSGTGTYMHVENGGIFFTCDTAPVTYATYTTGSTIIKGGVHSA